MEAVDPNKLVEIYLPYFFKVGNIFSQDFLLTCIRQFQSKNQYPVIIRRSQNGKDIEFKVTCAVEPQRCEFKLTFLEEISEFLSKGYQLKSIVPHHSCKSMNPSEEKRIFGQRRNEIKSLRKEMFQLLQERISRFGNQPPKIILTHLALRLDKYPNFIVRGANKALQQRIRKKFDNEVSRLKKYVNLKRQRSSNQLTISEMNYINEDVDSDSYNDSSFIKGNSVQRGTNYKK